MNDLDWEAEFKAVTEITKCTDRDLEINVNEQTVRRRKDVEKAFYAVKTVAEDYPDIPKREFRKKVYKEIIPGIWPIIIAAVISVLVKYVIEYLIDKLYPPDDENKHVPVPLPYK